MARRTLNLIVAADRRFGIGRKNTLPWRLRNEMNHFKTTSMGGSVVMGRATWESIPAKFRPLPGRENFVMSTNSEFHAEGATVCPNFDSVTRLIESDSSDSPVFIIGGSTIYEQALQKQMVDNVYLSLIEADYDCDVNIPSGLLANFTLAGWRREVDYCHKTKREVGVHYLKLTRPVKPAADTNYWWRVMPQFLAGEHKYLALLQHLLNQPLRKTRNGNTRSTFNETLKFNLLEGLPAMTSKRLYWKGVAEELNFFINGRTDSKMLHDKGVRIWDQNTTREFLDNRGLSEYRVGDMGPMYGWVWRHFGADYSGCDTDYTGVGFDQLRDVINRIRTNPSDRRIMMTTYDPSKVLESVLAPCHSIVIQFYCDGEFLDCTMYQRSADVFLGVPFNIASTSLLLSMVAKVTGRTARNVHMTFGDLHLYESHMDQALTQLSRPPLTLPTLSLPEYDPETDPIEYLESVDSSNAKMVGYRSHPPIRAKMVA